MFYPHAQYYAIRYFHSTINWAGWAQFIAILLVGILAACIARRQADLEDYAEIFIRPCKISDNQKWELQIRSACPRVVYVIDGWFEENENKKAFGDLRFSRGEPATLPEGEHNYYSLPIPDLSQIAKDSYGVPTFNLHIKFRDVLNKEWESRHAGWFQKDRWVIHNLKSNQA